MVKTTSYGRALLRTGHSFLAYGISPATYTRKSMERSQGRQVHMTATHLLLPATHRRHLESHQPRTFHLGPKDRPSDLIPWMIQDPRSRTKNRTSDQNITATHFFLPATHIRYTESHRPRTFSVRHRNIQLCEISCNT